MPKVPLHRTQVEGEEGRWIVTCEDCGPVGHPQEYWNDADAIADRHQTVEGFEKRYARG